MLCTKFHENRISLSGVIVQTNGRPDTLTDSIVYSLFEHTKNQFLALLSIVRFSEVLYPQIKLYLIASFCRASKGLSNGISLKVDRHFRTIVGGNLCHGCTHNICTSQHYDLEKKEKEEYFVIFLYIIR